MVWVSLLVVLCAFAWTVHALGEHNKADAADPSSLAPTVLGGGGDGRRITGPGTFSVAAVGESFYVEAYEAALGRRRTQGFDVEVDIGLLREPDNQYDPNAIGLYLAGRKVGHLSRGDAIRYQPMFPDIGARPGRATCRGRIRGGWSDGADDEGHFSLTLDLPPSPGADQALRREVAGGAQKRPHPAAETQRLDGPGRYAVDAVGESRYREAFEAVVGPRTEDGFNQLVDVVLARQPDNRYDPNAVALYIQGRLVGHLSRLDAVAYQAPLLEIEAQGRQAVCKGRVRGGWDRGDGDAGEFGLRLDLPDPRAPQEGRLALSARQADEAIEKIRGLKGREPRRKAVDAALTAIEDPAERERVLLEASRVEAEAVLTKVSDLKSKAAKRKHLQAAIAELESDAVPDHLQEAEIRTLKQVLFDLVDEERHL